MYSPNTSSSLLARIVTAAVLIPLLVATIAFGSMPLLAGVLGLFLLAASYEWGILIGLVGAARTGYVFGTVGVTAVLALSFDSTVMRAGLLIGASCWWLVATIVVFAAQAGQNALPTDRAVLGALGWLCIVPSYFALLWLYQLAPVNLLVLLVLVWTADSIAYFGGRRWGKRRLAPLVSPGKTWVGAYSALGGASAVSIGIALWLKLSPRDMLIAVFIALIATMAAIVGDLFESLMKRRHGTKDSGSLLPGHGGVLDRIDGLVAAAPVYTGCLLVQAGVG